MSEFKEKYDDLINKGYIIEMYEGFIKNQSLGRYKAYFIKLTKPNKQPFIHYSKESFENAVVMTHELLLLNERYL